MKKHAFIILTIVLCCMLSSGSQAERFGKLEMKLPDSSWSGKYVQLVDMVNLFKAGHYRGGDPTVKILIEQKSIDESMRSAKAFMGSQDAAEYEVSIGGYTFKGYREEITVRTTAILNKLFFAVDDSHTLRFTVFEKNADVPGLKLDDPELAAIIVSVIEQNGLQTGDSQLIQADYATEGAIGSGKWSLSPDGVLKLSGTKRASFANSSDVPWYFQMDKITAIELESGFVSAGNFLFKNAVNARIISLPDGLEHIGLSTFSNCKKLESVHLPRSLKSIDYWAFYHCSSLKEIIVGGNMEEISNYTFQDCSGLLQVVVLEPVNRLGFNCFDGCTSMKDLYLPDSLETIDQYALNNCPALQDIWYAGTEEQWNKVTLGSGNEEALSQVSVHFESPWTGDGV